MMTETQVIRRIINLEVLKDPHGEDTNKLTADQQVELSVLYQVVGRTLDFSEWMRVRDQRKNYDGCSQFQPA